MSGGPTRALAEFAAIFPGARISEGARTAAARSLLDTLACALGALREESSRTLLQVVGDEAAAGPCTVVGLPRRITPREAALINGGLAHALDFDDTHDLAVLHPGVAVIPAALAAAETAGASGPALIDAIVVGYDVQVRVALAAQQAPGHAGWHYTSACGIFGAAAAAGRLLGLGPDRMAGAFGLALSQAAGTLQSEHDGTWSKRLQPGLAASGGVLAARLAAQGFRAPHEALEGRFGFFRVYLRDHDATPVLESLGQRFEVERTSLKPFPTCRFTHAPIAALQEILRDRALPTSDIEQIEARLTAAAYAEVCEPPEEKVRPASRVHAQFSLPFALACVAEHGTVGLADLSDEGIRREEVLVLADRVRPVKDADLQARWGQKIGEAEVRVRTREGAVVAGRALPPGRPEQPIADADLFAKVKECLGWGGSGLGGARLIQAINALRHSQNLSSLSEALTVRAPLPPVR